MTLTELKKRVDEIIAMGVGLHGSDAEAHCQEDELQRELLAEYLPPAHAAELRRLWDADFERWYA